MPRRSSRWPGALALVTLACVTLACLGSCRAAPGDCKFESSERCLWEAGVAPPDPVTNPDDLGAAYEPGDPAVSVDKIAIDETLTQMISIIGAGLEWPLVDEQARTLCSGGLPQSLPQSSQDPERSQASDDAWICGVDGLEINNQPLALEASDGVLSLSAVDIDDVQSAALFEFAQRRFAGWCAGGQLRHFEGEGLQEFYRCSLEQGPYLVVARFPRELEADRWQVSIAIVDAG